MLRMIMAAAIAYILIPEDLTPRVATEPQAPPLSAAQTLDAAGTVLQDLGDFCTRNPDACETGRILLETARQKAQVGLSRLSSERTEGETSSDIAPASTARETVGENSQTSE